eukprot:9093191-Pyramimonas_sp.AAC.1
MLGSLQAPLQRVTVHSCLALGGEKQQNMHRTTPGSKIGDAWGDTNAVRYTQVIRGSLLVQ